MHVGDILFVNVFLNLQQQNVIESMKNSLKSPFKMTDFGKVKYSLGVQATQNFDDVSNSFNQKAYAETVLYKFGLSEANSVRTS